MWSRGRNQNVVGKGLPTYYGGRAKHNTEMFYKIIKNSKKTIYHEAHEGLEDGI